MATKKITLNELRTLVKQILREQTIPIKKFITGNFTINKNYGRSFVMYTIYAKVIKETEKAYLISFVHTYHDKSDGPWAFELEESNTDEQNYEYFKKDETPKISWIPKSQVQGEEMSNWIAKKIFLEKSNNNINENLQHEDEKKQLKIKLRELVIKLANASNLQKAQIRDEIKKIDNDLNRIKEKEIEYSQIINKEKENLQAIEDDKKKQYYVSYVYRHEEGATQSSFKITADSKKDAINKALSDVENRGVGLGTHVQYIADYSGRIIYGKENNRVGWSIYDR